MRLLAALLLAAVWAGCHEFSSGSWPVVVRACRLYDEPVAACVDVPESTAPLSDEPGQPATQWLLVPGDLLALETRSSVRVDDRDWYEIVLPDDSSAYVPAPLAQPMAAMPTAVATPRVVAPTMRVLRDDEETPEADTGPRKQAE